MLLSFLKIDMRHWGPPIKGPISGSSDPAEGNDKGIRGRVLADSSGNIAQRGMFTVAIHERIVVENCDRMNVDIGQRQIAIDRV